MTTRISELLENPAAIAKLGARSITVEEVRQMTTNRHRVIRNPRAEQLDRRFLIGRTNGGRSLTVVVEATDDPTTWMIVTAWESTERERKLLGS